jgi:hypothetical protein
MTIRKDKAMAKGKYHKWLSEDGLIKIQGWARDGLIDEQIAHNMGITTKTLYEWKNKYGEISEALKKGKEVVDRQVENALLKRALGYTYDETTYEDGVETKRVTKEVTPDTTAQIFWLKNRKPTEWRDKIEQQQTVTIQDDGFLEALKGTIKDDWDETS